MLLLDRLQQKSEPILVQYVSTFDENSLILKSNLSDADIIKSDNHQAYYLCENGFKRHVSTEDLQVFVAILNSTEEYVILMSHVNHQSIPTKKWLLT